MIVRPLVTHENTKSLLSQAACAPVTNCSSFKGSNAVPQPNGRIAIVQNWDYVGSAHTVHFQYSTPVWLFRAPANPNPSPYYATSHPSIFFFTC